MRLIPLNLAISGVVPRSLNRAVLRIIAGTVDTTAKGCRHNSYRRLPRHARQTPSLESQGSSKLAGVDDGDQKSQGPLQLGDARASWANLHAGLQPRLSQPLKRSHRADPAAAGRHRHSRSRGAATPGSSSGWSKTSRLRTGPAADRYSGADGTCCHAATRPTDRRRIQPDSKPVQRDRFGVSNAAEAASGVGKHPASPRKKISPFRLSCPF